MEDTGSNDITAQEDANLMTWEIKLYVLPNRYSEEYVTEDVMEAAADLNTVIEGITGETYG